MTTNDDDFNTYVASLPSPGAKKKKQRPEAAIQRAITLGLQARGLWVVRVAGQGTMQYIGPGRAVLKQSEMAGFPDLLVLGPTGRAAWLEVKSLVGRLSPLQKSRHERLSALGHVVAVVRSLDDALAVLRTHGLLIERAP